MMGTGRYSDVAMAALPTLPTTAYLLNSDAVFSLGASGSPAAMTGRFISATIKIGTGVVNHTSPGGGLYGIFMRTGLRTFSVEAVIAAKDTDDIRTLFMNDTLAGMTIVTTSRRFDPEHLHAGLQDQGQQAGSGRQHGDLGDLGGPDHRLQHRWRRADIGGGDEFAGCGVPGGSVVR